MSDVVVIAMVNGSEEVWEVSAEEGESVDDVVESLQGRWPGIQFRNPDKGWAVKREDR